MSKGFEKEYVAPWEKAFDRVLTPLEDFIHRQTTSGVLLMLCAIVALFIANSQWNGAYHDFLQSTFVIGMEGVPAIEISTPLDQRWFDGNLLFCCRPGTQTGNSGW